MSSGYDPVSYPDKVHFASGDGGQEYRDDHDGYDTQNHGNGIYNNYTVGPKTYGKPLKIACFKFENTRRSKIMLCCGATVVISVIMVIIVAVAAHKNANSKQSHTSTAEKSLGLIAYGPDGNGMMTFTPGEIDSVTPVFNRLSDRLADYSLEYQAAQIGTFMPCNNTTTSVPSGRECMQTVTEFGANCQKYNKYGLYEGRPCVLLVLKLDEGVVPKPFNKSYMMDLDAKLGLLEDTFKSRYQPSAVGISCQGKSDKDKSKIGKHHQLGSEMTYHPAEGFQLYHFLDRKRTASYIPPAVMVQFNTLHIKSPVTIRCTAWAESFANGKPKSSDVYSTDFTISMTA